LDIGRQQHCQASITVDNAWLQWKKAIKEHLDEIWKNNLGSGLQVRLKENRGDSHRWNWTQTSSV